MYTNHTRNQRLAKALAYSGLLPFLYFPVYLFFTGNDVIFGFDVEALLVAYSAVIVSFIAGIHWGIFLFKKGSLNLFLCSNIIALLACLSIFSIFFLNLIILILCLFFLILIDSSLFNQQLLDPWFYKLRLQVSTLALLSLFSYGLIAL